MWLNFVLFSVIFADSWVDVAYHLAVIIGVTILVPTHLVQPLELVWRSGGRLNKKDGLTTYGNSHVKDKTF